MKYSSTVMEGKRRLCECHTRFFRHARGEEHGIHGSTEIRRKQILGEIIFEISEMKCMNLPSFEIIKKRKWQKRHRLPSKLPKHKDERFFI